MADSGRAVEEHLTVSDGCGLWTARAGAGPPVVFVHGGPGLWDMFGDLADALSDEATTYRWDQRGCGRSQDFGPYTLDRTLADLDELRARFGHERITLIGHSWGADLALRYALAHPRRVARLVAVSATGLGRPRPPDRRRLQRLMAPHQDRIDALLRARPSPERDRELWLWRASFGMADQARALDLAARLFDPCFTFNEKYNEALNAQTYDLAEEDRAAPPCRDLAVPTLVLHGAHDPQPPAVTDSLVEALPRARRVVLDGAGHYPWVEQPDATAEAVRTFLTDNSRVRGRT